MADQSEPSWLTEALTAAIKRTHEHIHKYTKTCTLHNVNRVPGKSEPQVFVMSPIKLG